MISSKQACEMARALEGVTEKDHFGSDAFVANKRTFATVWHDKNEVNLRLSPDGQRHFLSRDGEGFVEFDNGWGRMGWLKTQLDFVSREDFAEALKAAWEYSAQKSPAVSSGKKKSAKPRAKSKRTTATKKLPRR